MGLKGAVTYVSFAEIYGWARFSERPFQPPLIRAIVDGKVVGEAVANLIYEPFAYLGDAVARCGFMVDICSLRATDTRYVTILADEETYPGGITPVHPLPSKGEVFIAEGGIYHIFVNRVGSHKIASDIPLTTVFVHTKTRQLGSDLRRLGGLLGEVLINGESTKSAGFPIFESGFHSPEISSNIVVRWTDGRAKFRLLTDNPIFTLSFEVYALAAEIG